MGSANGFITKTEFASQIASNFCCGCGTSIKTQVSSEVRIFSLVSPDDYFLSCLCQCNGIVAIRFICTFHESDTTYLFFLLWLYSIELCILVITLVAPLIVFPINVIPPFSSASFHSISNKSFRKEAGV